MTEHGRSAPTVRVVPAGGAILERIVATTPLVACGGLSREAFVKYVAAQAKTAWALRHQRRFALMQGDQVLASADRYDLTGRLDRQLVTICGIAAVVDSGADDDGRNYRDALVERLVEGATREGADLALLFRAATPSSPLPNGFEAVPTTDFELTVKESSRHGAPMTLVRGGEDRDLDAIAAMGHVRADQSDSTSIGTSISSNTRLREHGCSRARRRLHRSCLRARFRRASRTCI